MPSDFRIDRDFNTPPDADDPYEVKLAYQRELQRGWQAMGDLPSAILDFPLPDPERWWTDPHGIDPESYQRRKML
jgi:hypothetical protein